MSRRQSGVLPRPQRRSEGKEETYVLLSITSISLILLASFLLSVLILNILFLSSLPLCYFLHTSLSALPNSPFLLLQATRPLSYVLIGCCGRLAGYICSCADGGAAFCHNSCLRNRRCSAAKIIAALTCREVRAGGANGESPHKLNSVTWLKAIGRSVDRSPLLPTV